MSLYIYLDVINSGALGYNFVRSTNLLFKIVQRAIADKANPQSIFLSKRKLFAKTFLGRYIVVFKACSVKPGGTRVGMSYNYEKRYLWMRTKTNGVFIWAMFRF